MQRQFYRKKCRFLLVLCALASGWSAAFAQTPSKEESSSNPQLQVTADVLKKVDQLVQQNEQLEKQNQDLVAELKSLRQLLVKQDGSVANTSAGNLASGKDANRSTEEPTQKNSPQKESMASEERADSANEEFAAQEEPPKWGKYTPNFGYKVVDTEHGDLSISIYTYGRYLNQLGLNSTYTDAFGNVKTVQRRQDFQLNKVQIKFLGWILSEKFRYFLYAWTSNASQGLGAQVVLAGNLSYAFNKHLSLGVGIRSLPGTRSVEGNFPFWLGVDTRLIADEFFRPSYTSGVWAWGKITDRLDYLAMVGNNLSTLGVSAAQLNNKFSTVSTALVWMPTTGEFGQGYGDFEHHENLATRFGAHFTRSDEDTQSQPNSNQFENTQIRLEDGTVIFTPNIFGQGITVTDLIYKMAAFDAGLKYRGYSLDGEYFMRWLDNFEGPGTAGLPSIFSQGFELQASAMVVPKTLQLYVGGSSIYGKYGNPFDFRAGVNWFPWHNKVVRWNTEFLYLQNSPVGYTAVPFAIGGIGPVFHTNLELAF
jgi:TolA-binding protein